MRRHENIDIQGFIDFLDENNDGSVYQEIKHMEVNGFDIAVLQPVLHQKMATFFCPSNPREWIGRLSDERRIALDVRRQIRAEEAMLPLDDDTLLGWNYEEVFYKKYKYTALDGRASDPTIDQVETASKELLRNRSDVVRYLFSVNEHNAPLGYNGGPNDHLIVRQHWFSWNVEDIFCEYVSPQGTLSMASVIRKVKSVISSN